MQYVREHTAGEHTVMTQCFCSISRASLHTLAVLHHNTLYEHKFNVLAEVHSNWLCIHILYTVSSASTLTCRSGCRVPRTSGCSNSGCGGGRSGDCCGCCAGARACCVHLKNYIVFTMLCKLYLQVSHTVPSVRMIKASV